MSVTTSSRLNPDQLAAQLPSGVPFKVAGTPELAQSKTITCDAVTDAALQTAVDAAAAAFVDYAANGVTLRGRAQAALTANATFLGLASPSNAQTLAQVQTLTKECSAVIRLLTQALDTTAGT